MPAPRPRLSFERIVGVLGAAVALGLAYHLGRELASPRELAGTDFTVFRTGWSLILAGRAAELYDATAQGIAQRALLGVVGSPGFPGGLMAFLYPPHAALAGCALEGLARALGGPAAFWAWTACGVFFLTRLARGVRDELAGDAETTLLVTVTFASFYPVFETLQQGQISSLLAWAELACATAIVRGRGRAAAGWLLVLSLKPQTLAPFLVVLAARRQWRVLAGAAALGAGAVLVTAAVLGPRVWVAYLAHVRGLESFFGAGTPDYMPTVRGLLTRLAGTAPAHRALVDAVALGAWLVALGATAVLASRARVDAAAALAFALAAGALTSPHLFPQDLLLWIAPVTLVLGRARRGDLAGDGAWRRRSRVVLAWPLWFVASRALDLADAPPPRLLCDPTLVPLALATVWAAGDCRGPARA